jgi:hypothetical protein
LIPKYLAFGSAIASVCTQLFIITAEIIIAAKVFSLRITTSYVVRLSCFLLCTVAAGYLSLKLPFDWKISFMLMLCLSGILVFVFGLVKFKEIGLLLKKR